jgi:ribonuclease G
MISSLYRERSILRRKKKVAENRESIKPKNFGVIVRTAAEGKNTAELHEDLNNLVKQLGDHSEKSEVSCRTL